MSIINDALKKTEADLQKKSTLKAPPKNNQPKTYLLYILILAAGLFLANFIFNQLKNKALGKKPAPPKNLQPAAPALQAKPTALLPVPQTTPVSRQPVTVGEFTLNGIFISDDGHSYALINNRIVQVDDMVDGSSVKAINENSVELVDKAGKKTTLSNR